MALSSAFGAAAYTQADVENLIGEIDRDPANMDKIYKFGNSLYGQVPFPAALFRAAKDEMLRRYREIHIPLAIGDEAAARHIFLSSRDPDRWVTEDGEDGELALAWGRRSRIEAACEQFNQIADSNASTMAHVAGEAMKADRERNERQEMLAQAATGGKNNIAALVVQAGKLEQPVAAPKVAKFKPRVAMPSR